MFGLRISLVLFSSSIPNLFGETKLMPCLADRYTKPNVDNSSGGMFALFFSRSLHREPHKSIRCLNTKTPCIQKKERERVRERESERDNLALCTSNLPVSAHYLIENSLSSSLFRKILPSSLSYPPLHVRPSSIVAENRFIYAGIL